MTNEVMRSRAADNQGKHRSKHLERHAATKYLKTRNIDANGLLGLNSRGWQLSGFRRLVPVSGRHGMAAFRNDAGVNDTPTWVGEANERAQQQNL